MGIFASLIARMGMDTSEWTSKAKTAAQDADTLNQKTKKSFRDILAETNKTFGKSSLLGQSLKIAAGGGAIAALSKAGAEVEHFTSRLVDLQRAFIRGDETSLQFANHLAEEIPILGQFYKAGEHIGEMARAPYWISLNDRLEESTNRARELTNSLRKMGDETREALAGFDSEIDRSKKNIELLATPEGPQREIKRVQQQAEEDGQRVLDKMKKAGDALKDAQAKFNAIQKQLDAGQLRSFDEYDKDKAELEGAQAEWQAIYKRGQDAITAIVANAQAERDEIVKRDAERQAEESQRTAEETARKVAEINRKADAEKRKQEGVEIAFLEARKASLQADIRNAADADAHKTSTTSATRFQQTATGPVKTSDAEKGQLEELKKLNAQIDELRRVIAGQSGGDDDITANI